jgi:hypothetical protein
VLPTSDTAQASRQCGVSKFKFHKENLELLVMDKALKLPNHQRPPSTSPNSFSGYVSGLWIDLGAKGSWAVEEEKHIEGSKTINRVLRKTTLTAAYKYHIPVIMNLAYLF